MRKLFELTSETASIVALFKDIAIEQVVTFEQASKAVGFPVDSRSPSYQTAKRIAVRDHGIVIEGVRGVGFERLNGTGMVRKGHRSMTGIRRAARRGGAVASVAIRQNLTRGEQLEASEQLGRFRIIETTSQSPRPASNRQIIDEPEPARERDPHALLKSITPKKQRP